MCSLFFFPCLLSINTYRGVETPHGTSHTAITSGRLIILGKLFIIVSLLVFVIYRRKVQQFNMASQFNLNTSLKYTAMIEHAKYRDTESPLFPEMVIFEKQRFSMWKLSWLWWLQMTCIPSGSTYWALIISPDTILDAGEAMVSKRKPWPQEMSDQSGKREKQSSSDLTV